MEVETAALVRLRLLFVVVSMSHTQETFIVYRRKHRLNLTYLHLQVRAAEDILSLTRILKESWLFGKLQTVGVSEAENRAEEAARKVAAGLSRLQSDGGVESRTPNGGPGDPMEEDGGQESREDT